MEDSAASGLGKLVLTSLGVMLWWLWHSAQKGLEWTRLGGP